MSNEFRKIAKCQLYEIDKEGNVQKIYKQVKIIPFPIGGNNVIMDTNYGKRESFKVSDLLEEVWGIKSKVSEPKEVVIEPAIAGTKKVHEATAEDLAERAKDREELISLTPTEKVAETPAKAEKKQKEKPSVSHDSPEVDKILKLDCKKNIKIYKLSQIGMDNKIIATTLETNNGSVYNVLKDYASNPDKVEKANAIVV